VTFTLSPDGTLVTSYRITGVVGGGCQFTGEGDSGVWPGAPVESGGFRYQLGDALVFQGTFTGAQVAAGTFDFHHDATSAAPSCDSGTVSWTATTATTPSPGSGGGGGIGGGGVGGHHEPTFATRVTLRRASTTMLRGQIRSPNRACLAGRKVILWRGKHRIRTAKSNGRGKFTFARTASMRNRAIRASTPALTVRAGACAAGSSTFIRG
jgi:hypothetical protein